MASDKITCPKCGHNFAIESALSAEIESRFREDFDRKLKAEDKKWEQKLAARQEEMDQKLHSQREKLRVQAEAKAREENRITMEALQEDLAEKKKKLEAAQRQELTLRKDRAALEEAQRNMQLELERKMADQRESIRLKAIEQAAAEHQLKDAEKDKQLNDMKKQIDDLKRKAEQGSVQTQGEVLELELERLLAQTFPLDTVDPVAKGKQGADITQKVCDRSGQVLGTILWETKNAQKWAGDWLTKLKADQRDIKANIAVLVSDVLPKGVARFALQDGCWVSERACALGLAAALRHAICETSAATAANQDREGKMEHLYNYLSGVEFRQRVDAITEAFISMKKDLETEKSSMERIWSKREKQLGIVIQSTARMYGDLQGIIGTQALPKVKSLELPPGQP